jgi:hypothetical protein
MMSWGQLALLQSHGYTRYRKLMSVVVDSNCVLVMAAMSCPSLGLLPASRALVPKTKSSSMLLILSPSQSFSLASLPGSW